MSILLWSLFGVFVLFVLYQFVVSATQEYKNYKSKKQRILSNNYCLCEDAGNKMIQYHFITCKILCSCNRCQREKNNDNEKLQAQKFNKTQELLKNNIIQFRMKK